MNDELERMWKETILACYYPGLLSRHQNVGQNHDMQIANRGFENVAQFRYLGTTITNQNLILEEIKRRLNSANACYHSVQNLLSSRLLSKNKN
jgi:hypothetical protein